MQKNSAGGRIAILEEEKLLVDDFVPVGMTHDMGRKEKKEEGYRRYTAALADVSRRICTLCFMQYSPLNPNRTPTPT